MTEPYKRKVRSNPTKCRFEFSSAACSQNPANRPKVPAAAFHDYWEPVFGLNDSFKSEIRRRAGCCNYTSYLQLYLTFPPPGIFPDITTSNEPDCNIQDSIIQAAKLVNPCYSPYHITDLCPYHWNVLGDYDPPTVVVYFNRSDVQQIIHAPLTDWVLCTKQNVFPGPDGNNLRDLSRSPAQVGILQRIIEQTNNVIIANGNQDGVLNTNGTLLAIQNMTWNGLQGFQSKPGLNFIVPNHQNYNKGAMSGAGIIGYWGAERGFTFAVVHLSGHSKSKTILRSQLIKDFRSSFLCSWCSISAFGGFAWKSRKSELHR